MSFLNSTAICA